MTGLFIVFAFWLMQHNVAYAMTCTFASAGTNDWNTAANWDCGWVPTSTTDVIVPASTSTSLSADGYAYDITVQAGGTIDFGSSANFLYVSHDWTDSGSAASGTSYVVFTSSTPATITSSSDFYQVRIQKTLGALTSLASPLSVTDGGISISSDLDLAGNDLTVQGNLNEYGYDISDSIGTATVRFTGSSDSSIYLTSSQLPALAIQKTAARVILTTNVTTTRALDLTSGTLDINANRLYVGGDWTNSGGSLTGNGSVYMFGTSAATIDATADFPNLTIQKSGGGSAQLTGDITVLGDFYIYSDLDLNNNRLSVEGSYYYWGGNATDAGPGSVYLTGSSDTFLYMAAAGATFKDLNVNKIGAKATLTNGNVTTTDFTLLSGTYAMGSNTMYVGGDWTNSGGTLEVSNHGVVFNGSGPSDITGQGYFNDMTIQKTGGATTTLVDTDLQIDNAVWLRSGVLDMNGHTVSVAYGWNALGGTTTDSGTVRFAGGAGATIDYDTVFPNLTIDYGSSYVTLNATVTTTHNLIIDSGFFRLNGQTLHVGGNWTDNGGTLMPGSGIVDFYNGAGDQYISAETNFGTITITKAANSVFLSGDININGSLTLSGGGILNVQGQNMVVTSSTDIGTGTTVTSTSGTIYFRDTLTNNGELGSSSGNMDMVDVVNSGNMHLGSGTATSTGTLTNNATIYGESGTLVIEGAFADAATFTAGIGTVKFAGGSAQSIPQEMYYDLNIDKSANAATLAADTTTTHDLTITNGTLAIGTNTMYVQGDMDVMAGGTLDAGTGTFVFDAPAATQYLYNANPVVFYDVREEGSQAAIFSNPGVTVHDLYVAGALDGLTTHGLTVTGDATNTTRLYVESSQATFQGVLDNSGTFYVNSSGSATLNGTLMNSGNISLNSATNNILRINHTVTNSGTLTAGSSSSSVIFGGSLADVIPSGWTFDNLTIDKAAGGDTADLAADTTVNGDFRLTQGTFGISTYVLHVGGDLIRAGGTFDAGTGTVDFDGTGLQSLASGGSLSLYDFSVNKAAGTLTLSGNATATHDVVITAGTFALGSSTLFVGHDWTDSGTLSGGTGTVVFNGTTDQAVGAEPNFNNVTVNSGHTVSLNGHVIMAGDFDIASGSTSTNNLWVDVHGTMTNAGLYINTPGHSTFAFGDLVNTGTLDHAGGSVTLSQAWTNSGTYIGTAGTLTFDGAADQTVPGGLTIGGVLSINKSGGTATLGGDCTTTALSLAAQTLSLGSHTLHLTGSWNITSGLFDGGTGTLDFDGSGAQNVPAGVTFYGLALHKSGSTLTLDGDATATHAFTNAAGTFAVGANTFSAPGTYVNDGLVTRTTGTIKHPAESKNFTNVSWATQTGFTVPAHFYLQVQDANRNLDGTVAESITVPVTTTGGDSETITLTESGPATGIFRSSGTGLFSGTPHPGSGAIEISSNSVGTETYTDDQDSSDHGSTTATLTYAGSTGGGGGGGGGSGYLPAPVTTYQSQASDPNKPANLANLAKLNIAIHSLVKLPDDGNLDTQEDSAVYYIGADGKRHAFPNAKVYFSWYPNFDGVQVISAEALASIPLGSNVRYKPGSRMVKFTTDPKVYAVDVNGQLRWVKTETIVKALYGADWNTKIDDLSDAFFGNYTFGPDINSASDFDPAKAMSLEQYISDDLSL